MEAMTHRDRQRDPATPVDLEAIHARVRLAAEAASSVKAEDVKILDMHELVTYTDYLVLCTGRNSRLTKRIAEEVAFKLKQEYRVLPYGSEGLGDGEWVLLDYLDFMVHVFTPEAREFYRLDVLWKSAPVEDVE
jgi:ribosome-associated protein